MTEDLHHRLTALAAGAAVPPLDLERLSLTARRRRRRRRLLAVAPVAALLLLVPVAWSATGSGDDRLSQLAGAGPAGQPAVAVQDLQATVSAEVVAASGTTSTLAVSADPESRPLGASPAEFAFTWSVSTEREASFSPFPRWSTEVSAAEGPGVIGVGSFCGAGWDPDGQRQNDPCAAAEPVVSVAAGDALDLPLFVYAHVGDRQAAIGTYRVALPLHDGHTLEVAITVTEQRAAPVETPASPDRPTATPPSMTQSPAGTQTVQVFFRDTTEDTTGSFDCSAVLPVQREVPATEAVATAALEQLFGGPTGEEASGVGGFGPETAGLLRSVRIAEGTAYVDLDASYLPVIGNFSTSCGMSAFYAMVGATLTQFPTVTDVRYAFDGDPRTFVEWMQGGCPDGTPPPGDPCDPEPFRR